MSETVAFSIVRWTEAQFSEARAAWNGLLARSAADPLFSRWEWQHTWWRTFADSSSWALFILAAHDERGRLAGIAPLFRRRCMLRNVLPMRRIELIGNVWRGPATMRTQHLDFIAREDCAEEVRLAFVNYLFDACGCDEIALSDVKLDSSLFRSLQRGALENRAYFRCATVPGSYYVDTTGSFDAYLSARGGNTRLQMYNRRKYLARMGKVEVKRWPPDHERFFSMLNRLHAIRWGREAFAGRALEFNRQVAGLLEESESNFTELSLDGRTLSVLYNYRVGGQEYYIQGGFDEGFDRKVALGFLHLGYAIEEAFKNPAIRRFNLLCGAGKNSAYKARITRTCDAMTEIQAVRSRGLKLVYRACDSLRSENEALQPGLAAE